MRSTFLLLTASLVLPSVALAQGAEPSPEAAAPPEEEVPESEKARATNLFNEGRELMDAGDYAGACSKFEQSQKARPGIGTLYNLADCKEKLGFTATAYKLFVDVADRTKAALQTDREEKARERVKSLEPRLMRLRLSIPKGGKVMSVKVDNVLVPEDDYNKALPYDPGEHTIEATTARDEGEPFTEEIELSEEGKTVTVAVPVAPGAKMKPRVGMIVGGGITMGVGALALIGASALVVTGEEPGTAVGLGVLGIVGLAVGIPIFAVGFKKRPVREGYLDVPFEPSPIPTVAIGPTGGSLTWEF